MSDSQEYEPSQEISESPRKHTRKHRAEAQQGACRISILYQAGGAEDSQTTDSQYVGDLSSWAPSSGSQLEILETSDMNVLVEYLEASLAREMKKSQDALKRAVGMQEALRKDVERWRNEYVDAKSGIEAWPETESIAAKLNFDNYFKDRNSRSKLSTHRKRRRVEDSNAKTMTGSNSAEADTVLDSSVSMHEVSQSSSIEQFSSMPTLDTSPLPPLSPPPRFTQSGRPARLHRLPKRFIQVLPEPPAPLPPRPPVAAAADAVPFEITTRTAANTFGIMRQYTTIPRNDPEEITSLEDLNDAPSEDTSTLPPMAPPIPAQRYGPYANATIARLMKWQYTGSASKSVGELDRLVKDVIQASDFNVEDLPPDFSAKRETDRLDQYKPGATSELQATDLPDGWRCSSVSIPVPDGKKHGSENDAPRFVVDGLYHRPLVAVMKQAVEEPAADQFHYVPFPSGKPSPLIRP
ncbi:hypothetical protein DENSPDRAFT_854291 [Dentipellis sp. KUC8613]|nr:hypothetical protein DENSPDRAFT_854291 [Dentipellis sp. KUC8613]